MSRCNSEKKLSEFLSNGRLLAMGNTIGEQGGGGGGMRNMGAGKVMNSVSRGNSRRDKVPVGQISQQKL